jgi:hypothetical protein
MDGPVAQLSACRALRRRKARADKSNVAAFVTAGGTAAGSMAAGSTAAGSTAPSDRQESLAAQAIYKF